jgi:uncharacterized membrane protein (TIGR02234 family)
VIRRSRPLLVLAGLVVAGLVMLSWTQTWFTLKLDATSAVENSVTADGSDAAGSYTALALASLALWLALTIAGPIIRIVLGVVQVLLGVAIVATGIQAVADPIRAASSAVSGVAGVSDIDGIKRIVTSTSTTFWPYLGIVAGALAVVLGLLVLVLQRHWPRPGRKYGGATARPGTAAPDLPRDAVIDWDDLSAGVDPTEGNARTGHEQTVADAAGHAAPAGLAAPAGSGETGEPHPVGLEQRRDSVGAHDNEEHREQH